MLQNVQNCKVLYENGAFVSKCSKSVQKDHNLTLNYLSFLDVLGTPKGNLGYHPNHLYHYPDYLLA